MKHLILITSILVIASCTKITKEDLNGNWLLNQRDSYMRFWELNFNEDKVELIDEYNFKEVGEYQIENGKISIQLDRDDFVIETKIQNLEIDTLTIFDSLTYLRDRTTSQSNFDKYEYYRLINIPTNSFISNTKDQPTTIHYYKSKENEVKIRIGDFTDRDYQDIISAKSNGYFTRGVLILIGEGITLKDLNKMYHHIGEISYHKFNLGTARKGISLGTKREGISDIHIFNDSINIWYNDLKNLCAKYNIPPIPPPPIEIHSKEDYLSNGGKEIRILGKDDFRKIDGLTPTERYVISIDSDLSIEDYFELKKRIFEKEKQNKQIFTEIK